ncbi:dihydroneopterin aldolase [Weeksellaceae bacterium A-14]
MTSKIFLEDVKIFAYHGVLPEERSTGTWFTVNIEVHVDFWKATETDNLNDTVSYADLNAIVHREMAVPSQLMEFAAGRILRKIHSDFPEISYIRVRMTKHSPPMQGEMKGASVEIEKKF